MNIEIFKAATPGRARQKEPVLYVSNAGQFAAFFGCQYVEILGYLNTPKFYRTLLKDLAFKHSTFKKEVQMRITVSIKGSDSVAIFLVRAAQKTDGQVNIELVFESTAA